MSRIKSVRLAIVSAVAAAALLITCTAASNLSSSKDTQSEQEKDSRVVNSLELSSNRYAQSHQLTEVKSQYTTDGYRKVGENDSLELWLDKHNAKILIVDKSNGYVWGGGAPSDGLNGTWDDYANSIIGIEYFDVKNVQKQQGLKNSKTTTTFQTIDNGFKCKTVLKKPKITLSFTVTVAEDGIRFQVKNADIEEKGNYKLKSITFFPFLGSSLGDQISGYVFVPDGPGALMPFKKSASYLTGFDKKVYGYDLSVDTDNNYASLETHPGDYITQEPSVTMPVMGIVHGQKQNALLYWVDKGDEYSSITATPSGMTTEYNWGAIQFNYRQRYLQPTSKKDEGIQLPQASRNAFDADMTVHLLHGKDADYAGMARAYREHLEKNDVLPTMMPESKDIPLQVSILGADTKKQFLVNGTQVFTTASQAKEMLKDIETGGIHNVTTVLRGFGQGGVNGGSLTSNSLDSRLGNSGDYKDLQKLSKMLYLYNNPVTANKNQINIKSSGGIGVSKTLIFKDRKNQTLLFPEVYYYSSRLLPNRLKTVLSNGWGFSCQGVAVDNLGSSLYEDYAKNQHVSRNDVRTQLSKVLAGSKKKLALYGGNQYLLRYTSDLFDLPMCNSQYLFESDTVPFVPMVLSGTMNYYAPELNTSGCTQMDLLKMIEFGACPSYILTQTNSSKLADTPSQELFSTCYQDWKVNIQKVYQQLDSVMAPMQGHKMVDHKVIASGHVEVSYDNGKSLYVNYTDDAWQVDSALTIPPLSAGWGAQS